MSDRRRFVVLLAGLLLSGLALAPVSVAGGASSAPASAVGGPFTATGSMSTARVGHTATLLRNGRVLIAGGEDRDSNTLASAELYDPATGRFSATGSMAHGRVGHTATLLRDGRVLIVGGWDELLIGDSAELYDPETGRFTPVGPVVQRRALHSASLLPDGRVLIAGGVFDAGDIDTYTVYSSTELYDPATGTFSTGAPMHDRRYGQSAAVLSDGRVLIVGGESLDQTGNYTLASAEVYDPATGRFTLAGAMSVAREITTATLLGDGRVLIAGGTGRAGESVGAAAASGPRLPPAPEVYDPDARVLAQVAPTGLSATSGLSAVALGDGRVLVVGGGGAIGASMFDSTSGSFIPAGAMVHGRLYAPVVRLPDGRVLIAGGLDDPGPHVATATAELFTEPASSPLDSPSASPRSTGGGSGQPGGPPILALLIGVPAGGAVLVAVAWLGLRRDSRHRR